jgi:hypothetical protein
MRPAITAATLALVCSVSATSYGPPESKEVPSSSGKFHLKVDAQTNIHEVTGPFGKFIPNWHFCSEVDGAEFFVSDDGESAVVVKWRYVGVQFLDEPAVVVYTRFGARRIYSYRELSKPRALKPNEGGPVGDHWRSWRSAATAKANKITIFVEGAAPQCIDLASGRLLEQAEPRGAPFQF